MLRNFAILVGAAIVLLAVIPIAATTGTAFLDLFETHPKEAATEAPEAKAPRTPPGGWPQQGPFGTYDRAALQRGYQVYAQVCSTCHSMKLLAYRDLETLGFSPAEVKAIASNYQVTNEEPNDQGAMYQRQARPSDAFISPFPNDQAARAGNNGSLPPDLSLIVKARKGHEDYIYSLLTGFGQPPATETIAKGMNYNPYFASHQIAMPPPLHEGAVSFADGTPATVDQMAKDVTQYLAWAGEPHLEERHQSGLKVILFLAVFAGVMYGVKKNLWSRLK